MKYRLSEGGGECFYYIGEQQQEPGSSNPQRQQLLASCALPVSKQNALLCIFMLCRQWHSAVHKKHEPCDLLMHGNHSVYDSGRLWCCFATVLL